MSYNNHYNGYTSNSNGYYKSYSMSYNAAIAYDEGYKPKSKWTKKSMLEVIKYWLEWEFEFNYDDRLVNLIYDKVKKWKKDKIFIILFEYKGSHHVGKFYQLAEFYGLDIDSLESTCQLITKGESL